ncbi:hypothetical protein WICMUC_000759 [Wickerhamomyces mucosus]|uniref:Class E vacuolar protein-sorting machinery protein HSE1 n=1 Tax=Wickerhamomyces mucosus TaxID=1378264 RepID=A0A9P8THG6_9ASCO|nr:hypothetical protein WICMUC_000759 [Wickerhamomyces mucosus]
MKLSTLISKTTSPSLLEDDWSLILGVCDEINKNPEDNIPQAISELSIKLQLKDANVQLRSLSLLLALNENCGSRMKQAIATKSFMGILKERAGAVHQSVRIQIIEVLKQLYKSDQSDPSLRIVKDTYDELLKNYGSNSKPDVPKKQRTNQDDDDDDLRRAIELSLKESQEKQEQIITQQKQQQQPQQQQQEQIITQQVQPQPIQKQEPSPQPRTFSKVRALYDSFPTDPSDLKFHKGDIITIIERVYKDWGKGSLNGVIGLFPFNYVTPIYDPTIEELIEQDQRTNQLLTVENDVNKLLSILDEVTRSKRFELMNTEEFQTLFNNVMKVKPELKDIVLGLREKQNELMGLYKSMKHGTDVYESIQY